MAYSLHIWTGVTGKQKMRRMRILVTAAHTLALRKSIIDTQPDFGILILPKPLGVAADSGGFGLPGIISPTVLPLGISRHQSIPGNGGLGLLFSADFGI